MVVLGTIELQDQNFDLDLNRGFFPETRFYETKTFFQNQNWNPQRIGKIAETETENETKER